MRVFLLINTLLLSTIAHAAGVTAWHPISNASTQAQSPRLASESHPDGITLDISIPGYVTHSLRSGGNNYQTINLPDWQTNSETGAPLIPQLDRCIAIPNNCRLEDIAVDFLVSDTLSSNLSLPPVPKSVNSILSFISDPAIYTQDTYYPKNPITIEKTGFIRDQKAAWIHINPVQYNPVSRKILIHKNLKLKIRFNNLGPIKAGPFGEIGSALFLNADKSVKPPSRPHGPGSVTYPTDLLNASVQADYILITTEGLIHEAVLDSLANYRAGFSGLDLAVVNTTNIYSQFPAADSSKSIRDFLISAFNRWTSAVSGDGHPLYVLFAGNGIPASPWGIRTYGNTCTDHLYSCVNDDNGDGAVNLNDWMPDFLLGRLSIRDPSDLTAFLAKIRPYEASLVEDADWRKKICLVNGFLDPLIDGEVDGQYYFIRKDIEAQDYFSLSESLDADDSSIPSVRE